MSRCTKAVIYKDNLLFNINQIKNAAGQNVRLCLAVKADGYGHNAVVVAKIAEENGIDCFAVATVEEAIELRTSGISSDIILLSLCTPEEFESLFSYNIMPLVFSKEYISLLDKSAASFFKGKQKFMVELAVDTGMGRIGCYPDEAGDEAALIQNSAGLSLAGMCTHFAVSDSISKESTDFTAGQYKAFQKAVKSVRARGINPGICSCGSSAALLNNSEFALQMLRPGIITYGYYPDQITKDYLRSKGKEIALKPVLSFETKVVAIRHFPKGKSVSYGRTWISPNDTSIAVLPVGYADGLLRRFSPGLEVTINGRNYPVRGRICMDQCMVDIGKDNPNVHLWDRAVIFGPEESGALNTADTLAKIGGTISYEVLTSITKRVRREVL